MSGDSSDYRNGKTYSYTSTFSYTGSLYTYYIEVKGLWGEDVKSSSETFCVSTPPTAASNASPDAVQNATVVSSQVILRWSSTAPDGDSITYNVYLSDPQTEGNYNLVPSRVGSPLAKGHISLSAIKTFYRDGCEFALGKYPHY